MAGLKRWTHRPEQNPGGAWVRYADHLDEVARMEKHVDAAILDAQNARAKVASLTARLIHYEELMVERACEERDGAFDRAMAAQARVTSHVPRACCDCRYWGDAHAHAVVCWACNNHSCWRPKLKPVERGCDSCRHWATVYCDPPCSLCEKLEWSRWEPKT